MVIETTSSVAGLTNVNPPPLFYASPVVHQMVQGQQVIGVRKQAVTLSLSEEARKASELLRQSQQAETSVQPESPSPPPTFKSHLILVWLRRRRGRVEPSEQGSPEDPSAFDAILAEQMKLLDKEPPELDLRV